MLTRHVQRAGLCLAAVFAALVFFAGGAALRLLMGPISLGPFASAIEDAINHSVSGVVVRFDQAVLEWSRTEGKVNLIILGTKVFDLDGRIVAQAPKADLDFDAKDILHGHLSLKRFGLIGVQITGVRSKAGAIRLGFGPERENSDLLKTIRDILQNSASGGGSLDSFAILNARLAFQDEQSGLFIVSPDTSFTLRNRGEELDASLESGVEISGVPARLSAQAVLRSDGTPKSGEFSVKGLSFPALVRNSASFAALAPYKLVSDLSAKLAIQENGEIASADFQIAGSGSVENAALPGPLLLQTYSADGTLDRLNNRVVLNHYNFSSDLGSAKGNATLVFDPMAGLIETVSADVDASDVRLDLTKWLSREIVLSRLSTHADYNHANAELNLQNTSLTSGAFATAFGGTVRFSEAGSPALTLSGNLNALQVADALSYWPNGVAEGARKWVAENISKGLAGPFRFDTNLPVGALDAGGLPDDSLAVSFPFEGMTVRYIASMTPITGAIGEAQLTGDTFHVAVSSGSIGPVALSNGDVMIPDLHTGGVTTKIKAHADGSMSELLQLIDQEPLGYPTRFGVNSAGVAGQGDVDMELEFPLLRDLALEQIRIGVQAKATDLALPIGGRKFEQGMVSFTIDTKSLAAQGTATLQAVPITFKWTEDFTAPGITTRIDLAGRLDERARANLGLSEPTWLTGTMPATMALTGRRFDLTEAAVTADMTNAAAEIPALNFAKRAGTRANAKAQIHFGDGGAMTISDMAIDGVGLTARGGMSIDSEGKVLKTSFTTFRSGINDIAIEVQPLQGGGLNVHIDGKTLDATHYYNTDKKKSTAAPKPAAEAEAQIPISLTARVDQLILHDDVGFKDVTLALSYAENEKLTGFSLDAMGTGKGKVTGRMDVVNGVRNLSVNTDDAGAFINTFMGFPSIRGGKLAVQIHFPIDGPRAAEAKAPLPDYEGTIVLSDVVVTDQPFLARLFSAGSLDGPLRLLQGEGIALSSVNIPFSARAKMVTIHEGRAAGIAIGGTFSGTLDREAERVDVSGSLIPVYVLNSFLGSVPVLGDLLVSKKGEGIIGLTYAMKGNLNEPALSVNPLSVLTPGIFRRIFEFAIPKERKAPAESAATAAPAQQ